MATSWRHSRSMSANLCRCNSAAANPANRNHNLNATICTNLQYQTVFFFCTNTYFNDSIRNLLGALRSIYCKKIHIIISFNGKCYLNHLGQCNYINSVKKQSRTFKKPSKLQKNTLINCLNIYTELIFSTKKKATVDTRYIRMRCSRFKIILHIFNHISRICLVSQA